MSAFSTPPPSLCRTRSAASLCESVGRPATRTGARRLIVYRCPLRFDHRFLTVVRLAGRSRVDRVRVCQTRLTLTGDRTGDRASTVAAFVDRLQLCQCDQRRTTPLDRSVDGKDINNDDDDLHFVAFASVGARDLCLSKSVDRPCVFFNSNFLNLQKQRINKKFTTGGVQRFQ